MDKAGARARADELLEQFHLADRAKADVYALSGGMAQRLMVARGIAHRPHILFLDEPTAGLDPQSRLALWEILHELHGEGLTVLLTTHYMEEADRLCDRVAIMDHGHILALDTPAGLKASVGADTIVHIATTGEPAELCGRPDGGPRQRRPGRDAATAPSPCSSRAATASCRGSWRTPRRAALPSPTFRSTSRRWRPYSSP